MTKHNFLLWGILELKLNPWRRVYQIWGAYKSFPKTILISDVTFGDFNQNKSVILTSFLRRSPFQCFESRQNFLSRWCEFRIKFWHFRNCQDKMKMWKTSSWQSKCYNLKLCKRNDNGKMSAKAIKGVVYFSWEMSQSDIRKIASIILILKISCWPVLLFLTLMNSCLN
jgi:hypothetical protein